MTRKHYKLLAQAFARIRRGLQEYDYHEIWADKDCYLIASRAIDDVEDEVCLVLYDENPAFSYQKFTDASGRRD